jgi:hypothetical protein
LVSKHFDVGYKRAAIELWKPEVPQRTIKRQLNMFKTILMRIFSGRERLMSCGL